LTPAIIINSTQSYYNFNIISADGFFNYVFAPDNFSTSPYYMAFTVSIGTPESLTGSNVTLDLNAGEWNYQVTQINSPYSLTPSNVMVDNGIMIVLGTSSFPISYTGSEANTIKIYTNL
jgi:hypothetical protein